MRYFSEAERVQIVAVGAVLLGLIYFFLIAPFIEAECRAARAELEAARAASAELARYRAGAGDDAEAVRTRGHTGTEALPASLGQGAFIQTAERTASAAGVTLDAVVPQAVETSDELTVQPIEISFHGGYFEILDFMKSLAEGPRAVQFGDMELKEEERGLHCALTVRIASTAENTKEPPRNGK